MQIKGNEVSGGSATTQKIDLFPHVPQFCPQNVDFVIFMQFLAILSKMSPHKSTYNGKVA